MRIVITTLRIIIITMWFVTKTSVDRQVELRLRDHDVRFTKGRRAVVRAMTTASGPMSAAELSELLGPDVPLSSLYRTLAILEDAGVAVPHLGAKGLARYELAEWLTGHHHHLVCIECGSVTDVNVPVHREAGMRQLVSEISASAGFTPTDHALEIEGRCEGCR